MRILHTADWHLGKIFNNVSLTDDQAHVLEQVVALAKDARPDAIIIAGDVFDRAVPPPEAVALWDEVVTRLARETPAHIVVIAGNHDSPHRLGLNARLLEKNRVHLRTRFDPAPQPLTLEDGHGPVLLFPLPYVDPARARSETGDATLQAHADVFARLMAHVRERMALAGGNARCVVAAHATVLGGRSSESERSLAIGGAEQVPPATFDGAHYVALGHLHRPQRVGADHVRYAGSLLKYSFSEATHEKSVSLVELDAAGCCAVEEIALAPRRDLRRVSGTLEEVLAAAVCDAAREDFLQVELTDTLPVFNAMEKLRAVYPNVLSVSRPELERSVGESAAKAREAARISPLELFAAFHREMTGEDLTQEGRALLTEILADIARRQREA